VAVALPVGVFAPVIAEALGALVAALFGGAGKGR
jgi:hypothetical protein